MTTIDEAIQSVIHKSDLERKLADFIRDVTHGNACDEVLLKTPARVMKALAQMTAGYSEDPSRHLLQQFATDSQDVVVVNGIDFVSLCEHHLMPFHGTASVAYIPAESHGRYRVVGLSKIPRLVDGFAKRLQLQERLTTQIGEAINKTLTPLGVAVKITARHGCLTSRGALKPNAVMVTQYLAGAFRENASARAEVLALMS